MTPLIKIFWEELEPKARAEIGEILGPTPKPFRRDRITEIVELAGTKKQCYILLSKLP